MSFANCRGSQAAKPWAAVAGPRLSRRRAGWICFGTRQTRQLVPAGPGGTGSWEGRGGCSKDAWQSARLAEEGGSLR